VFANFSPGLSFGNPGDKTGDCFCRNPEGNETGLRAAGTTLSGLRCPPNDIREPRVAKAQPWAEIGEHLRCNPAGELPNNATAPSQREEFN